MTTFYGEIGEMFEKDRYDFYLQAGKKYFIELEGMDTSSGTLENPWVAIYQGDTRLIFDDDGGIGLNARLVYTPVASGHYSIGAEGRGYWWVVPDPDDPEDDGMNWEASWMGTYRLLVNIDDYRGTAEGAGAAGRIGNARGDGFAEIDYAGDRDVFATQLISGLTYTYTQRGAPRGTGALADPELRLVTPYDGELARNNDWNGGLDAAIVYRAGYTGAHFLQAGAFSDAGVGSYRVSVGAGRATAGDDVVNGTAFADFINGLHGADTLRGGAGADRLFGAQHGDVLRGQVGNDQLAGGRGADILIGGLGADTFVYGDARDSTGRAVDAIRAGDGAAAFELAGRAGGDRIDLSTLDANLLRPGNQAFVFNSTAAGGLSLADSRGDTLVRGNLDNDAAFELVIRIEDGNLSHRAYGAIDFLL